MFVALVIQNAMRMRPIIFICVACPALSYFSTLSYKQYDFRGGGRIEHKIYVLILSTTFVCNISHSEKNWARYNQKCM